MSYRHYETESFIISLAGERGANRSVFLLSRELGPLWAHAQGLRREQSKLRYSLQAPAKTRVVLIKGKDIWRIVGAEEGETFWKSLEHKHETLRLINRVFNFLEKILVGEDANEKLFLVVEGLTNFVGSRENLTKEDIVRIELITVGRILHLLGFLTFPKALHILDTHTIEESDLEFIATEQKNFLESVNNALKASQY